MPINFPDSPSVNDTHTVGDKTWTWDGTSWNVVTAASGDHGNLAGLSDDDHTQYLRVDGSRSADSLTISDDLTVDTDTLHVDSTNDRVGIGTTTPDRTLHVYGATQLSSSTGGGQTYFPFTDGRFYYTADPETGGTGDHVFRHYSGGSYVEQMRILENGNVGIGTTTPSSALDVAGAISSLGSAMLGVRQVLASHKTGYSVTGTTEIDTGLSVTITPKSTSSKILIFWTHGYYLSGNCNLNSRLKRGTTELQLNYAGDWGSAGNGTANNYYLDTPNTTSAVTYKTTMQSSNTTGVYVSNSGQSSYLLVVEIL